MNIEDLQEYCLAMQKTSASFPFDENTLVFKVLDKMFALLNLDAEPSINLKCDPEKALELREEFPDVQPGYHMNKKHWNTILLNRSIPPKLIQNWIDDSYTLVVSKMTKKQREHLNL